jgi:hypothetical protein
LIAAYAALSAKPSKASSLTPTTGAILELADSAVFARAS